MVYNPARVIRFQGMVAPTCKVAKTQCSHLQTVHLRRADLVQPPLLPRLLLYLHTAKADAHLNVQCEYPVVSFLI